MDIVDCMLETHGTLRAMLAGLAARLDRPHGAGWDDCSALDREELSREFDAFFRAFKAHEAVEEAYLSRVLRQVEEEPDVNGAIDEGHRTVAEMTRLFGAVAFTCDGVHVHRLRTVLERLREELELHLLYEEKVAFPRLRARLPRALLQELGRRARSLPPARASR